MTGETIVQLLMAGGGSSAAALAFQAFMNRGKNRADVQASVNALAKDWLAMANEEIHEVKESNAQLSREVLSYRSAVVDMRDLMNDILEDLDEEKHAKVVGWRARFDKIDIGGV